MSHQNPEYPPPFTMFMQYLNFPQLSPSLFLNFTHNFPQVFVSPCVLLFYPLWIFPVTFGLGIYGGLSQISWHWINWRKELADPEKGFYGWFCNKLAIPDCSPYQVVILTALGDDDPNTLTSVI